MKTLTLILSLVFCSFGFAGPGHSHGHKHGDEHGHSHKTPTINEKTAQETGTQHIERLIKAGKLDATWAQAVFDKSEKKKFGEKTEWVVTFNNEKGPEGKKLFIFLKPSGEFIAANFTGK